MTYSRLQEQLDAEESYYRYICMDCDHDTEILMTGLEHRTMDSYGLTCNECKAIGKMRASGFRYKNKPYIPIARETFEKNGRIGYRYGNVTMSKDKVEWIEKGTQSTDNGYSKAYKQAIKDGRVRPAH